MGVNRMTGTPWHAERVHRSEGDKRRYKGRCKYFYHENNYCSKRCGRCIGSAHCDEYDALTDTEFQKKQKYQNNKKKKQSNDDDVYWY